MRALYLYFADTATPGSGPTTASDEARPMFEVPLTPIKPGAFSRWMAGRERAAAEADEAAPTDRGSMNPMPQRPAHERGTSR
jgi:hypothetical protein